MPTVVIGKYELQPYSILLLKGGQSKYLTKHHTHVMWHPWPELLLIDIFFSYTTQDYNNRKKFLLLRLFGGLEWMYFCWRIIKILYHLL